MTLDQVIARLPYWFVSRQCVFIKSPPGFGKTTTLLRASSMLSQQLNKNIGHVLINGALLNPPDSIGYLIPKHNTDGTAESVFTNPFFFRTAEGKLLSEYDGGIIIVDEIDKADVDIKKIIGEAALHGRLGPHQLPPGWMVWMAGNRQQDRSGSTKELDHLINRRREINIDPDFKSWRNFVETQGVLPVTVAFAERNPQIVFADAVPEKQGPWCTPRSLVMLDEYIRTVMQMTSESNLPDDAEIMEEAAGQIGMAASSQYFTMVKLEKEMPKFEEIISDPNGVRIPLQPDAQMLVCYNLAYRVDKDTADPCIRYVERMPKDFAVTFANSACKRKPMLVTTPAFRQWTKENSSLLSVIALA